jgi:predicted RNase H-like HicB family nuclease
MSFQALQVTATWDAEAKVWVAESDQIPGLVTEAATKEEMIRKLRDIVSELLSENDGSADMPEVPMSLMWQQIEILGLKRA